MNILDRAKQAIQNEAKALEDLSQNLPNDFEKVVDLLVDHPAKVIVSGVGKSGIIGRKIAATLASTGTPAFFVHSDESLHGDLGMIEGKDIVFLISNSGETSEVLSMLPTLTTLGCTKIAITSKEESTLATSCDYLLSYSYEKEVDHLNLAPTTSALLTLALGDALATTVSATKDFKKEDFHLYHPGGSLGVSLTKKAMKD